jgi:hypothetical protein
MSLVNAIINKLKTSSIWNGKEEPESNIVLFSDVDVFPDAPYIVVKPETGIMENTQNFRIIVHMNKGKYDELKNFVFIELDNLLLKDYLNDGEGGRYKLYPVGFTDVTPERIDNTYFAERIYFTPLTVRN